MIKTESAGRSPMRREQQLFFAWYLFFAIALIVCVWFYAADVRSSGFMFTLWADRDLHRAFDLATTPQTMGPEVTGAGRTPGGFYYYLLAAILHLNSDPEFVFAALRWLGAGSLLILILTALKYFGRFEAVAFAVFFFACVQLAGSVTILWNPPFVWPCLALNYALFVRMLANRSTTELPWLVLVTALGAQIHMSLYSLLVAEVVAVVLFVGHVRSRTWALSVTMLALALGPYFVADWSSGFTNSRQLSTNHSLPLLVTAIERLPLTIGCFLVTAFGLDGGWMLGLYPALHQCLAFGATSFLAVITAYHYGARGLRALRDRRIASVAGGVANVKRGLALVLGAGLLIQRVGGIHEAREARYFLILAPAALYLAAAALKAVVRRLTQIQSSSLRALSCGLLILWASTMIGFNLRFRTAAREAVKAYGILLHGQLEEVQQVAFTKFGFGADDMASRTLFLVGNPMAQDAPAWAPVSPELYVSWPTYIAPWDDNGEPMDTCLMVMIRPSQPASTPPTETEALQALNSLALRWDVPPTIRRMQQTPAFTYVLYDSLGGNCLRSFSHRYNLSPTERLLEADRQAIVAAGVHRIGGDLYGVSLNHGPDAQLAGVRLTASRGEVRATLYGNALRGYDGNNSRALARPTLVFTSTATGNSFERMFFDTVGGANSIVLPPWRMKPLPLMAGEYVVKLVAKYTEDARFGSPQPADLDRILDSHFVVNADVAGDGPS